MWKGGEKGLDKLFMKGCDIELSFNSKIIQGGYQRGKGFKMYMADEFMKLNTEEEQRKFIENLRFPYDGR